MMNRNDFTWWLALIANAGVIAGLAFLGYEIRQNTVQLRADASRAISESMNSMNAGVYGDSSLAEILLKGRDNYNALTEIEKKRFSAFQFSRINLAIYIQDLESEGMSDVNIRYVDFIVRDFQSSPGLRQFAESIGPIWAGSDELYEQLAGKDGA